MLKLQNYCVHPEWVISQKPAHLDILLLELNHIPIRKINFQCLNGLDPHTPADVPPCQILHLSSVPT